MTSASVAGLFSAELFAASPRRLVEGKVWLLFSSGLLVQRPVAVSLFSFALLAFFTRFVCGARVLFVSGLVGHVGSTLLAYSLVGTVYLVDAGAVGSVVAAPDYGVSAIQAAWIGAIATTAWRRKGQTRHGRALIVLACLGVGLFAWMLRGDLTILDVDHLFAFAIGVSVACASGSLAAQPLGVSAAEFCRPLITRPLALALGVAPAPPSRAN